MEKYKTVFKEGEIQRLGDVKLNVEIYHYGPNTQFKKLFSKVSDYKETEELSYVSGLITVDNLSKLKDYNIKTLKIK